MTQNTLFEIFKAPVWINALEKPLGDTNLFVNIGGIWVRVYVDISIWVIYT